MRTIHFRDVPDRLYEELIRRAASRGLALSDYIVEILEREISRRQAE